MISADWLGILISAGSIIATAVWAVGSIKGTTSKLEAAIASLTKSVDRVDTSINDLWHNVRALDQRLSRMEGRSELQQNASDN